MAPRHRPNAVVEIPLFDRRLAQLLEADAGLQIALRQFEAARIAARTQISIHQAEVKAMRQQLRLLDGGGPGDPTYRAALLEYWRARSALAFAAGDWAALSGL